MDKIGICGGGLIGASWALGFSSNKYNLRQDIKSLIYSLKMRYSDSFFESERLINSSKYLSN